MSEKPVPSHQQTAKLSAGHYIWDIHNIYKYPFIKWYLYVMDILNLQHHLLHFPFLKLKELAIAN